MSEELEKSSEENPESTAEAVVAEAIEAAEPAIPFAVEINSLTKVYKGRKQPALQDFSLKVPDGQVLGLIGANGAGKTTALKILATLLEPTSGSAFIKGLSVTRDQAKIRRIVGFMPDNYGLYDDMQVSEYLEFFASCYNIRGKKRNRLVNELLELVDLADRKKEVLSMLSRGMRQRLCLAHTLIHDPQVLLLDEPASGLDPRSRTELRELLRELSRMGKTIIISSHVLGELEDICEAMGVMQNGKLVAYGLTADVISNFGRVGRRVVSMRVLTRLDLLRAIDAAKDFPEVVEESIIPDEFGRKLEVELKGDDTTCAAFLSHVTSAGVNISQFNQNSTGITDLL
jgi:ABC-2 type transport system ATP-binding protein